MDQVVDQGIRNPDLLEKVISALSEGVIILNEFGDILWVNQAALKIHEVEYSDDLGRTCKDYARRFEFRHRNNRRLVGKASPMARAVAGETFSNLVVEIRRVGTNGPAWTHSVSSVPLEGPSRAKKSALIISDLTEQFEAESRFECAFNANPAPALVCRLSDFRYIKANPGFLEMTGYARGDVIGRSAYELDVLSEAEKRELAIERLMAGRTIPQMEACIPLRSGERKFVIVAGEPIRMHNEPCMLFTFADLDPLKKTELALRRSEERFSKSFHLSPVPQTIATLKGFRITEVNKAFREMTGFTDGDAIGRSVTELVIWDDKIAQRQIEGSFEKIGGIDGVDLKMRTSEESAIDCLVSAVTVTINDELCVLWVIQDIADRKRSESELVAAIEAVMEDTSWFSRTVVEKLARLRRATQPPQRTVELDELTDRERDILDLICQGQSDEGMSETLGLSRNTIRNHISSLYRKIDVNRRAAAVIWARERGVSGRDASRHTKSRKGNRSLAPRKVRKLPS